MMQKLINTLRGMTAAKPDRRAVAAVLALFALGLLYAMNASYIRSHVGYFLYPPTAPYAGTNAANATNDAPARAEPNRLWIPAIGLSDVPIIRVTKRSEEAYQAALASGVGHFPGTAAIGQPGNAYLFGHSSDYARSPGEYKSVFALLSKLKPGDVIIATDTEGTAHEYAVTESFVIDPDDFSVLDQFGNQKSLLTLQTSWPLGTALKRYIVRAELSKSGVQAPEVRTERFDDY